MGWPQIDLPSVIAAILERPGPVRLVAVDGRGGAGKTTFAAALAAAAGGARVVHTDTYADRHEGRPWWPELLREVIDPLANGAPGAVEPAPIVIIEGVSAGRREWADHLTFVIWIDTPAPVRRARVVARDGPDAEASWAAYEAEEDAFYAADPVRDRADVIIEPA